MVLCCGAAQVALDYYYLSGLTTTTSPHLSCSGTIMAAKNSGLTRNDPRSSSQESLVPAQGEQSERRKLLLVYIHGFMGNETSFRSFPAHVHSLLAVLLAETHVVHTKIYPRYRSRGNITVARDSFSDWIEPHQDPLTDVVLLGHSMGGLLCAEIALMPPSQPAKRVLNHRILGTINFDVPFLGMHPGVVKSGLSSLFSPAEEPRDVTADDSSAASSSGASGDNHGPPSRTDTLWSGGKADPNYNPHFGNDVVLPVRKGWQSAWHFINKHSDDLTGAAKKLITSHLEFGGAMANYSELKTRYARIRALEEEDDRIRQSVVEGGLPQRIRFVNYYTASTGRSKNPHRNKSPSLNPKTPGSRESTTIASTDLSGRAMRREDCVGGSEVDGSDLDRGYDVERPRSTSSSIQDNDEQRARNLSPDKKVRSTRSPSPIGMMSLSPRAEPEDPEEECDDALETLTIGESAPGTAIASSSSASLSKPTSSLPSGLEDLLPPLPEAPPPLNVSFITDKATRKLVEKEHAKAVKDYEKVVKNRTKLIQDHAKAKEKQAKKDQKATSKVERKESEARKEVDTDLTHSEREALRLEHERQRMEGEGRRMRGETSPEREVTPDVTMRPGTQSRQLSTVKTFTMHSVNTQDSDSLAPEKIKIEDKSPPKDRMFCTLPPKDSNGERDPCWVRVYMKNVDEVGAHCGLFFVDERYEKLVGDVAERIEGWVKVDIDIRMLESMKAYLIHS